jgi:hypothetical protein
MAASRTSDSRKRTLHDEEIFSVNQTSRKKVKSEAPGNSTRNEPDLYDSTDEADEANEDADEDGGPYSENREPFPNHPAFDKQIPEVKLMLTKLATEALASVNKSTCDTAQVNELRGMAQSISVIPEAKKQIIGLIGEAGQGQPEISLRS